MVPMSTSLSVAAIATLVPALVASRHAGARDWRFWTTLALALAGPAIALVLAFDGRWQSGFASAMWLGVVASLGVFAVLVATDPAAARLSPLVFVHALGIGLLATGFAWREPATPHALGGGTWLFVHIVVAILGYGALTVAAVAALGVWIQEAALKARRPTALTRVLPPVVAGEGLQIRMLTAAALLLIVALATGMAVEWQASGQLLRVDHKTLLVAASLAAVLVILAVHRTTGLSGRRAGRFVLVGYLLATLAYPGVKFVGQVLLGRV